jgi:predicted small lipoprotein YifL
MLRKTLISMAIALPILGGLAACDDKGPAEKAGEKIDNAAQSMKDAIDPPGPAEEAGRKLDNALDSDN